MSPSIVEKDALSNEFLSTQSDLAASLARVRIEIERACARSGRRAEEVTIVAVTKTFSASAVDAALAAGLTDIGENRVQELRQKADLVGSTPRWHMIGHLQKNKVRDCARICEVIQTVDSRDLAARIAREATALGREIDVLIQVNIGEESQKSGVAPQSVVDRCREADALEGIHVRGLMALPPVAAEKETRAWFRRMAALSRSVVETLGPEGGVLSMGMSGDFAVAIEEGSTMIRLGRVLFGERG